MPADKKVFLITTTGASREDLAQRGMYRSFELTIDSGIFRLSGIKVVDHIYCPSVPSVTDKNQKNMLDELRTRVRTRRLAL